MERNPDDVTKYRSDANDKDYADPEYYLNGDKQFAHRVQSSPSSEQNTSYDSPGLYYNDKDPYRGISTVPYEAEQIRPYRGPKSVNEYANDTGTEQRETAKRGQLEEGNKKKGGLLGLFAILVAVGSWALKL